MHVDIIQSAGVWKKVSCLLSELGLYPLLPSDTSTPGSQAFELRVNYSRGFPGSATSRQ
jgi:hypothetical protein